MRNKTLRKNRPVQTELDMDVWVTIFANSKPDLLFKLRLVCSGFRDALSPNSSVWKHSLNLEFSLKSASGLAVPDPPPGLSWINYTYLLTGRGCQACGTKSAKKTRWAFERRYCDSCLTKKIVWVCGLHMPFNEHTNVLVTVQHEDFIFDLEERQLYPYVPELLHSLPRAEFGPSMEYMHPEESVMSPAQEFSYGFLRSDVVSLQDEFLSVLGGVHGDGEISTFWQKKIGENEDRILQLQKIEKFVSAYERAKSDARAGNREAKKAFYQEKALALDPPIETKILERCHSYILAYRSPRLLRDCECTWPVLLAKLRVEEVKVRAEYEQVEREEAEEAAQQLVQFSKEARSSGELDAGYIPL